MKISKKSKIFYTSVRQKCEKRDIFEGMNIDFEKELLPIVENKYDKSLKFINEDCCCFEIYIYCPKCKKAHECWKYLIPKTDFISFFYSGV